VAGLPRPRARLPRGPGGRGKPHPCVGACPLRPSPRGRPRLGREPLPDGLRPGERQPTALPAQPPVRIPLDDVRLHEQLLQPAPRPRLRGRRLWPGPPRPGKRTRVGPGPGGPVPECPPQARVWRRPELLHAALAGDPARPAARKRRPAARCPGPRPEAEARGREQRPGCLPGAGAARDGRGRRARGRAGHRRADARPCGPCRREAGGLRNRGAPS
jgi:hypothetical protein